MTAIILSHWRQGDCEEESAQGVGVCVCVLASVCAV